MSKPQTQTNAKAAQKKKKKITKIVIASTAAVAVVIMAIVIIPKLTSRGNNYTSITTYNVDQVTYGDVDTVINGSGTLTPITKETWTLSSDDLIMTYENTENDESGSTDSESESTDDTEAFALTDTNQKPTVYTITYLDYVAGYEIDEGDIIMELTDENGNEYEYAAPYDCVILDASLNEGDEISQGSTIVTVMGREGFTMGIAVDEYDIATVELGQEVTFTVNAISEEFTGEITKVSYNGSSSGGTTAYQITATMEYSEGIYPGMTVSAEIVIKSSGDGLLVPVDAVYTSGDDDYIYLAPSDAEYGDEYEEDELDLSKLTKVYVETGMSDGSYIIIKSSELIGDDLVIVTKITSTQTGSSSSGQGGQGGMGGMGGMGGFPGGGMDFGDFDFGSFDPGSMPGGSFPGFGG